MPTVCPKSYTCVKGIIGNNYAQYLTSTFGLLGSALVEVIGAAVVEAQFSVLSSEGGTWGSVVSKALGLLLGVVAVYSAAGLISAAVALAAVTASATLLFNEAYLEYGKSYALQKAADPPDMNFTVVDQYNGGSLLIDLGLGAEKQDFFEKGFQDLSRSLDSSLGVLNAYERGQGASLAGDAGAAWFQARSLEMFKADEVANDMAADNWLTAARGLIQPPTSGIPEPATWLTMIFGLAVVGYSLRRRNVARGVIATAAK